MVAVWWLYGGCMVAVWWLYGGCKVQRVWRLAAAATAVADPDWPSDDIFKRFYPLDHPSGDLSDRSYCPNRPSDDFKGDLTVQCIKYWNSGVSDFATLYKSEFYYFGFYTFVKNGKSGISDLAISSKTEILRARMKDHLLSIYIFHIFNFTTTVDGKT